MRRLARLFALLVSVPAVLAVTLALALNSEYEDDTIGSSVHAWLLHGFVAVPVVAAVHLWKRSAVWLLALPCFLWTAAWESIAVQTATDLPFGWAVQEFAAPWLPVVPLLVGWWLSWPRKVPPGVCPSCGYDLRASSGRCPECGAAAAISN